jgi:hypothetical protein
MEYPLFSISQKTALSLIHISQLIFVDGSSDVLLCHFENAGLGLNFAPGNIRIASIIFHVLFSNARQDGFPRLLFYAFFFISFRSRRPGKYP